MHTYTVLFHRATDPNETIHRQVFDVSAEDAAARVLKFESLAVIEKVIDYPVSTASNF